MKDVPDFLYAWVGADQAGDVGLKCAMTPIGVVPLVLCRLDLASNMNLAMQMQEMARRTGLPVRLVRYRVDEVLEEILSCPARPPLAAHPTGPASSGSSNDRGNR
jgi:hypothetical protein